MCAPPSDKLLKMSETEHLRASRGCCLRAGDLSQLRHSDAAVPERSLQNGSEAEMRVQTPSVRHKLLGDFNLLMVSCLECCSLDPNTGFIFLCYSFLGSPPLPTLSSVWPFLPREKCCLSISFRIPPDREAQSPAPALCVFGGDCNCFLSPPFIVL